MFHDRAKPGTMLKYQVLVDQIIVSQLTLCQRIFRFNCPFCQIIKKPLIKTGEYCPREIYSLIQ